MIPRLLPAKWNIPGMPPSTGDLAGVVRRTYGPSQGKAAKRASRKVVSPRKDPGTDFIEALAHGIAVLECWRGTDVWLTNAELAERSGLTRPTVSRLVSVLESLGYVVRENKRGRLRLTGATLGLGYGSMLSAGETARAELMDLACELDVYAALSVHLADKVKIIENVASPINPDIIRNDVGALLPMCRSASGLAALSVLPESELAQLIPALKMRYGGRWPVLERQIISKKREYASRGYCTSAPMLSHNVGAVAVPFAVPRSDRNFIVACAMPAESFYPERVERIIAPKMFSAVNGLARILSP